jgi:hypothetical protein
LAIEFDPNGPPIATIPMECDDVRMEGEGSEEVEGTNVSDTSGEGNVARPRSKVRAYSSS